MGNIQDVGRYERVPIFGRSRSRTPRRIAANNNSPYHRQLSRSVYSHTSKSQINCCRNSQIYLHKNAIRSVIKYGDPYSPNKYQRYPSTILSSKNGKKTMWKDPSFDADGWENSYQNNITPKNQQKQLPFKKISSLQFSQNQTNANLSNSQVFTSYHNSKWNPNNNQSIKYSLSHCEKCHGLKNYPKNFEIEQQNEIKTQRKHYVNQQMYDISNIQSNNSSVQKKIVKNADCSKLGIDNSHHNQSSLFLSQNSKISAENSKKCEQIIRKVRNFNDFLNQVKKKLKNDIDHAESYNQTSIDTDNSRSVVMSIKLENQKIELEKYRNLVNRQLSKQHSIESIQIQTGRSNLQKIIKINYQSTNKDRQQKIQANNNKQLYNKGKQDKKAKIEFIKRDQSTKPLQTANKSQKNILKNEQKNEKQANKCKIRKKYEQATKKMSQIGSMLTKQQDSLCKRMQKINNLMGHLEGVNEVQQKSYREITQILYHQSQDDESEVDY